MQQPRYFSTQPSANGVPAQQVMAMMPAQQGHMVAGGQPMMYAVPQYAPMMANGAMQPAMYQPVMHQQQPMKAVAKVEKAAIPNNVQPKLEHAPAQKQFTVVGVPEGHKLEIDAPRLSWQMTKKNGNYVYTYDPADKTHEVSVTANGQHVEGSPFTLTPKPSHKDVELTLHDKVGNDEHHHLTAANVHDVNELHFETDMEYKLLNDKTDAKKFHFHCKPNGAVHTLDVMYGGKSVPNGKFEFVPKKMRPMREAQEKHDAAKAKYEASIEALKQVKLNAANEEKRAAEEAAAKKAQEAEKKAAATEKALVMKNQPHMTATPPTAQFGPMVMSSEQPHPMMAAQQQPMMMGQQPMMMPMAYANANGQPMYQMMPVQGMMPAQGMMPMQPQQPMYRQN